MASLLSLVLSPPPANSRRARLQHAVILFGGAYLIKRAYALGPRGLAKQLGGAVLQAGSNIPGFGAVLEGALAAEIEGLERDLLGDGDEDAHTSLPSDGLAVESILEKAQFEKEKQGAFERGQKWGGVYHAEGTPLCVLQCEVLRLFNSSNSLYPGVFPGVRKFEAEVVSMVLDMVGGPSVGAVGLLTSGGTESILIAVLSYRELARKRGIPDGEAEIIAGITAHPALLKACFYFGLRLVKVPVCPKTQRLLPALVRPAITKRTIAIYASAPTFCHGVVDPIRELGALALEFGLGCHVDNCLGGFLLSFLDEQGLVRGDLGPWDFRAPGVTTMSVDVHKYGFASKGCSVVGFADPELRRLTYVPSSDGALIRCSRSARIADITPTLQGSRGGATIAQAWATLLHVAREGYRKSARDLHALVARIKAALADIPELELLLEPDAACVPLTAAAGAGLNVYAVASRMEQLGWNLFTGQNPAVLTICLGEQHLATIDELLRDLGAAVKWVIAHPDAKVTGSAAVYGAAAATPDAVLDSLLRSYNDIRLRVKPKQRSKQ